MNTWGLYHWFRERSLDLIHPDDWSLVQAHSPQGVVCEVIGKEGQYLTICLGRHHFRGKPELFQPVSAPLFRVGQPVWTKPPRTSQIGIVRRVIWHFKMNEPLFFLEVNGKGLKSRYRADELEATPAESNPTPDSAAAIP